METGDNVLIGGFIITGTQPKRIIVRAIGPSLPLTGALADPILELRDSSGGLILSNDNWRIGGQEAEIIATAIPPSNDSESAIVATLPANNSAYTAIVRGVNNGTGIGVVEAYDLDQTVDSKLANISTRGLVQTGRQRLDRRVDCAGAKPLRVIVRAIGPSLPVPGALANPTLELRDGDGALVASNDNWRDDPREESEINATGIPPTNDLESAIVRDLAAWQLHRDRARREQHDRRGIGGSVRAAFGSRYSVKKVEALQRSTLQRSSCATRCICDPGIPSIPSSCADEAM